MVFFGDKFLGDESKRIACTYLSVVLIVPKPDEFEEKFALTKSICISSEFKKFTYISWGSQIKERFCWPMFKTDPQNLSNRPDYRHLFAN